MCGWGRPDERHWVSEQKTGTDWAIASSLGEARGHKAKAGTVE